MKQRPILFSAPMVRAILGGNKTQTRRSNSLERVNLNPEARTSAHYVNDGYWDLTMHDGKWHGIIKCPYGQVGDQLWVREAWRWNDGTECGCSEFCNHSGAGYEYRATGAGDEDTKWKPSIHMPRKASRIQLEITGVRVERLNHISRGDCMAEGCPFPNIANETDPIKWYMDLWESLNGHDSWNENYWVWVIEFKVIN